jgi:hypothetical protein
MPGQRNVVGISFENTEEFFFDSDGREVVARPAGQSFYTSLPSASQAVNGFMLLGVALDRPHEFRRRGDYRAARNQRKEITEMNTILSFFLFLALCWFLCSKDFKRADRGVASFRSALELRNVGESGK